jgi:hypothetical protein
MRKALVIGGFVLALVLLAPAAAAPPRAISTGNDQATLEFPDRITFSVDLRSDAEINDVVLEYGVQELTCGQVVAKAFPTFTAGKAVSASWTWEMKQSGSEPPGARIWWRWQVHDAAGQELLTEPQTITWLDNQHPWQTVTGESLNLHWYDGTQQFATELHTSATQSIANLGRDTGLVPAGSIDLYLYANQQDLRDAILYEPQWIGGEAFPEYNIVIMAVGPDAMEWGKRVIAHELTHVLAGHYTFSCLGEVPAWLDEGLAVYGEGGWTGEEQQMFEAAVADDTLLSVRALGGGFSENPGQANVAYGQSYSLVHYLLTQYGQEKILALLRALRDGAPIDQALPQVYGLTLEGFEAAWRAAVGARPHGQAGQSPTATPLPTPVPTIEPISGAPLAPTPGPTRARPTPAATATAGVVAAPTPQPGSTPEGLLAELQALPGWVLTIIEILAGIVVGGLIVFLLSRLFRWRSE